MKALRVDLADFHGEEQLVLPAGWEAFEVTVDWSGAVAWIWLRSGGGKFGE